MIDSLEDTLIITEKTYISGQEHNTRYRIQVYNVDLEFSTKDFDSNLFEGLALHCTDIIYKKVVTQRSFTLQPMYRGMDVSVYIGRGKTNMNYCIINDHVIVVSTGDKYPGTRWLIIEGVWKIGKTE